MRRRFIILGIVIFLFFVAFITSGCSQLSSQQSTVDEKFNDMLPQLVVRYNAVESATKIAEEVGGKRDVTEDATKALVAFTKAEKEKNGDDQLSSARDLETIIGRLNSNAQSSPKLSESQELKVALVAVDDALPASDVREAYDSAVAEYEEKRNSWRNSLSSFFGGYSSAEKLEFWVNDTET